MWLPLRRAIIGYRLGAENMKEQIRNVKAPSRVRLGLMMAALGLAYFFSNFHRLSLGVLGSVIGEGFGLSAAQLGFLGSAFFYAYAAMQIPSGLLSDRVGTKYLIAGSCLVSAVSTIWFGLAGSVMGLAAARALTGLSVAFVYVPALSAIRHWFGDSNLGTMTGILVAMGQMGAVCASAPLKLAADALGWRSAFGVIGYVSIGLSILAYFAVLNAPKVPTSNLPRETGRWKAVFRPVSFSIAIWFFVTGGARLSFQSLWGSHFFTSYLGNSPLEASGNLMWISVGCILGAMAMGGLCDRMGSVKTLVVSSIAMSLTWICLLLLGPESPAFFVAAASMALGFFGAGSFTVGFTCVREFVGSSNTGLLTGVNNCAGFLGSAVFTQISGSFVALFPDPTGKTGFFWMLVAFAILCLLVTGLVTLLNREKVFGGGKGRGASAHKN